MPRISASNGRASSSATVKAGGHAATVSQSGFGTGKGITKLAPGRGYGFGGAKLKGGKLPRPSATRRSR